MKKATDQLVVTVFSTTNHSKYGSLSFLAEVVQQNIKIETKQKTSGYANYSSQFKPQKERAAVDAGNSVECIFGKAF